MLCTPEEILLQRLEADGERVTSGTDSMVYLMEGSRFIAWMKPLRGLIVSPLPDDYGLDHYEAAEQFLREFREFKDMAREQPDGGHNLHGGRESYSPICTFCAHSRRFAPGFCQAFPGEDAIPVEIWEGWNKHTEDFPGDHGIRFAEIARSGQASSGRNARMSS